MLLPFSFKHRLSPSSSPSTLSFRTPFLSPILFNTFSLPNLFPHHHHHPDFYIRPLIIIIVIIIIMEPCRRTTGLSGPSSPACSIQATWHVLLALQTVVATCDCSRYVAQSSLRHRVCRCVLRQQSVAPGRSGTRLLAKSYSVHVRSLEFDRQICRVLSRSDHRDESQSRPQHCFVSGIQFLLARTPKTSVIVEWPRPGSRAPRRAGGREGGRFRAGSR